MKHLVRALLALAALPITMESAAATGRLFVGTQSLLKEVDPTTGATLSLRAIEGLGSSHTIGALAYDSATDTMFILDLNSVLWTLDYHRAIATLIGPLNLGVSTYGHGLAVDDTGQLFAHVRVAFPSTLNYFARVNRTTGQGTLIATTPIAGYSGIEFVASTGTMYIADGSNSGRLFTIDRQTGATSLIGPFGTGVDVGRGLAYDPVLGMFGCGGVGSPNLFSIDLATGAASLVGPLPIEPLGLAFVTDPSTAGTSFCFGDGSGAACPCGNFGNVGAGCRASFNPFGARLVSTGVAGASAATDTLVLSIVNLPNAGLLIQGDAQSGGGLGIPFGDGLLCVGGAIRRIAVVSNISELTASYPSGSTQTSIHDLGATNPGDVRHYQGWYRDATVGFCSTATYNLTQALTLTFGP